jgi:hypothetical protein
MAKGQLRTNKEKRKPKTDKDDKKGAKKERAARSRSRDGMIEFEFQVMGQRMTPETATTPAVASQIRAIEANFRKKLEGVVPPGSKDVLHVAIRWETSNTIDFNLNGPKHLVEAAGKRLQG